MVSWQQRAIWKLFMGCLGCPIRHLVVEVCEIVGSAQTRIPFSIFKSIGHISVVVQCRVTDLLTKQC